MDTLLTLPPARNTLKFNLNNVENKYYTFNNSQTRPKYKEQDPKFLLKQSGYVDKYYYRWGPNLIDFIPFRVTDDLNNWIRGVIKRCAHTQNYDVQMLNEFIDFSHGIIIEFPTLNPGCKHDKLFEEWMEQSNYNNQRKNKLRNLMYQLDLVSDQRRYELLHTMTSFIKTEFYGETKEARIINSRTDAAKAYFGGYISKVQELVMKEHFVKHKTPSEIAEHMYEISKRYPYVYETDYSSFEGSFTQELMQGIELELFRHVLREYPQVVTYLESCYSGCNKLVFNKRYKCKFKGSRMSGDMWTSLANGFTNFCLVKFIIHKHEQEYGRSIDYDFIVEGDDGFIATNCQLNKMDWFASRLGFKLKCDMKTDINDLSFCGICEHEGRLVPDIRRILNHYGYTCDKKLINIISRSTDDKKLSKRSRKELLNYIHTKAISLLATSRGIPILQQVALQQLRLGGHYDPKYLDAWKIDQINFDVQIILRQLSEGSLLPEEVTDSMRVFVQDKFNISIDTQLRIEQELETNHNICYDLIL